MLVEKVQVGKDQEKAQSEKDSHSKNRGGKKNKVTIKYLYHETFCFLCVYISATCKSLSNDLSQTCSLIFSQKHFLTL